jgi:threonine synthase
VTLVDGLITDAGKRAAELGGKLGWYDVSTLKEPYRIEGKKTMGYELAEQLDWTLPDWIIYPTGGGTGMVGMWKAFAEMTALGWIDAVKRPKMVTVQAENCAPIIRAFKAGTEKAAPWENAHTVPTACACRGDWHFLVLSAVRGGGAAIAVSDADMVPGCVTSAATKASARPGRRRGAARAPRAPARRPRQTARDRRRL